MSTPTDHRVPPRRPSRPPRPAPVPDDVVADTTGEQQDAPGGGFDIRAWAGGLLRRYWTPPKLWDQRAASLQDLSDYAHTGEWTSRRGFLRALGIGWWRSFGLPVTALCRRIEWVAQRPGRFFAVLLLFELIAHSAPGQLVIHWLGVPLHWLAWLI